jgi:hypothetical protein
MRVHHNRTILESSLRDPGEILVPLGVLPALQKRDAPQNHVPAKTTNR